MIPVSVWLILPTDDHAVIDLELVVIQVITHIIYNNIDCTFLML